MQITIDFGYDQVFELVRQLSPEEREKLVHDIQETDSEPDKAERKMTKEEYHEFLMNFPVISEEEIQLMEEAKKMVDQCRPISL